MKILTITNYYPPYFIGGYEIACKEMMDFLTAQGHEIIILASNYGKSQNQESIKREMKLIDYMQDSRYQRMKIEHHNYKQTINAIKHYKPNLIYFWSLRKIGLGPIEAANKMNIPKVFEIGDFWMQSIIGREDQNSWKQKIKNLLPFTHTKPVKIEPAICVSKWVEREMREKYGTTHSWTIYNATRVPPKPEFPENKLLTFIFVGRLDEKKGLDLAIEALKLFHKNYPNIDFELHIYGSGDRAYINHCKTLSQPIKEKIHFKGRVEKKAQMYTNGSILLMPTRERESFGLVVIEAMAHGSVVIATNAYGPGEIIQHQQNGLLFAPDDLHDLYTQVEKLHTNRDLFQKIHNQAYQDVKEHFSIEVVKPKVEALLKKIAGEAP